MRSHIKKKLEAIIEEAANDLNVLRKSEIYRKKINDDLAGYKLRRLAVIFYMKLNGCSLEDISKHVGLHITQVKKEISSGKWIHESLHHWKKDWEIKHKII